MNAPDFPLCEAHAHIPMYGRELAQPSLAHVRSKEECLDVLRIEAARLDAEDPARARWLLANGVRTNAWSRPTWPTRDELDGVCGARPIAVMSFDHHALAANTAAMTIAGITDTTPDPEGGVIERDASGRPTGLLLESAHWLVRAAVPELTPTEREAAVRVAVDHLASFGFSEVHDLMAPRWLGSVLSGLRERGLLNARARLYAKPEEFDGLYASRGEWESEDVRLGGLKLFADGTLNSRTAWTLEPFRNPMPEHPCGTALLTEDELEAAMRRCGSLGVECAVHAIGDGAVRACLNAYEASRRACGLRIEHCELVDPADVPRFAALGVVASVQPCHLLYDIEVLRRELPHREACVLPLRSMLASGLKAGRTLVFGSDAPIVRPDPMDSVIGATMRRRTGTGPAGGESEAVGLGEAIGEGEAWACFRAGGG